MQITRSSIDTMKGPADWFTGDVYVDAVAAPAATSVFAAASVHFTPGARTAWHTHPHGQTIFVTEGIGLCQREGGPIEVIRPGDRIFFEPDENRLARSSTQSLHGTRRDATDRRLRQRRGLGPSRQRRGIWRHRTDRSLIPIPAERDEYGREPDCVGRRAVTMQRMSVLRLDHTGVVVDDLEVAVDFFLELGLERDGTGASEGEWLDRIIGLDKSNIEFAFVRTPDGNGRLELCKFLSPIGTDGPRPSGANDFGLRHLSFAVDDLDVIVERLENKGFTRIGEIQVYRDVFRLCYIHGPEGIIVEVAERVG